MIVFYLCMKVMPLDDVLDDLVNALRIEARADFQVTNTLGVPTLSPRNTALFRTDRP
jgi:hypothetical protein